MIKKGAGILVWMMLAVSVWGCGRVSPLPSETPVSPETETQTQVQSETETQIHIESDLDQEEPALEEAAGQEADFDLSGLKNYQFTYASGAGAWQTQLMIAADGSFFGQYMDSDMGDTGEEYPDGTQYRCDFTGQFGQPVKVNDYTYSLKILSLDYEEKEGTEEIKGGIRYCYRGAEGLTDTDAMLLYLPGAPLSELPQDFKSWAGFTGVSDRPDPTLPFYGLYNESQGAGFSGKDVSENLKEAFSETEQQAQVLEENLKNAMTQLDLNLISKDIYDLWDRQLNDIWSVLKQTQDPTFMEELIKEQRAWIQEKEAAVKEAGAEYEGGTMQPLAMNRKGADLTKERAYELMELFQ